MTIGSNGYPVISSRSSVNGRAVTACANYACSSTTASTQVDSSATNTQNVISPRHIVLGSDGYPILVYTNGSSTVYVKHCTNSTCTSSDTTTTVESGMSGASQASIAVMPNGYPLIAYRSGSTSVLKTKACTNVSCSSFGTATTVDSSTSQPGRNVAMVFGNDGLPVMSTKANTNNYVRWTHCAVADCSSTSGSGTGSSGYNLGSITNYFNSVYAYKYYGKQLSIGSFDVAEEYKVEDQTITNGEILSINPSTGKLKRASGNDRNFIFGIVSTEPGLALKDYEANHQDTRLVALVGRVPLKTTGTINIGDPITIDPNNPGKGIKATTPGLIVGRAMESTQSGGTIEVFVQTQYYSPTEDIQGTSYMMMSNLNVTGQLRASSLSVIGDSEFGGNIKLSGHFITDGDAPDIEIATNIDLGSGIIDPVATVEGNDISGHITIDTTGLSGYLMPGEVAKITFNKPYSKKAKVFLESANDKALDSLAYRQTNEEYFVLLVKNKLAPNTVYVYDYLVVE